MAALEVGVEAFCEAVRQGDVAGARRLLDMPHVRQRVNEPLFDFGQRATHVAAKDERLLGVLMAAGADITLSSEWENGPYTVLDNATDETARFLLTRGATLTANVAARLGWLEELRAIVSADGGAVHARGGDGKQPLHEAATVAVAQYLVDRGAVLDTPCVDHRSTPAQYALGDRPDVCRFLLQQGATPDIYMAARLGDVALATRLIDADPSCLAARINQPGYAPVPPMHIYCWVLGFDLSPYDVARRFGHAEVRELLGSRSSGRVRFANALMSNDARAARAVLADDPSILPSLSREEHGHLARAVFQRHFAAAELMLDLGFDPAAPGVDGGSALHAACWVGSVEMVNRLLALGGVPLDLRDPTHGSTLLGWAAFGSVHRRAPGADYSAVVDKLVAAGADVAAVGNSEGRSLLEMAEGSPSVQETLRRHGAQ